MRIKIKGKAYLLPNLFEDLTTEEFCKVVEVLGVKKKFTSQNLFEIFCGITADEYKQLKASDVAKVLSKLNWLDNLVEDCTNLIGAKKSSININERKLSYKRFKTSSLTIGNIATIENVIKEDSYLERIVMLLSELIKGNDSMQDYLKGCPAVETIPLFNFFLNKLKRMQLISLKK